MKTKSELRYLDRIDRVVGYLNEQIEATPSLQDLAGIAGISPFHFHRLYRSITGETPFETLRRLRLARAAIMLRNSSKAITDIAFDAGYESSQAFSKAFRRETGCSATELRRDKARLDVIVRKLSDPPPRPARNPLDVRLVSVDPFKVIASRHIGPQEELFDAYGALFRWAEEKSLVQGLRGIYGVALDDPRVVPERECRFDCCFDFGPGSEPDGAYREVVLGGGLYAVARHVGSYDGLEEKSDFLYGTWLPDSGYGLRDVTGFNHYLADPDTMPPEEWETDVYIPVEQVG
jgi:AraC family transcriptional regulator